MDFFTSMVAAVTNPLTSMAWAPRIGFTLMTAAALDFFTSMAAIDCTITCYVWPGPTQLSQCRTAVNAERVK